MYNKNGNQKYTKGMSIRHFRPLKVTWYLYIL